MQEKHIKKIVIVGIIAASIWLIYKIISGIILLNIISNLTI